ncbi:MAG: Gfo/Idh/MocA family oxidoreductase [Kineosporiaceae bacterium]|nr:Gfo/Idh/MocA family oxidoreductase [Kineosporiaceae bacterium]MBK7621993.1 Gfo/Idh/MocA family oxidoreductase [Kineosporiaceae bacterium]MBK8074305.1 Gfo/Idh/MocA family oxidoreductase [Kineosporiaceae bacterium]
MRVLVIGAGRMGALRAEDLRADPRISQVFCANRSPQRARDLAAQLGLDVVDWHRIGSLEVDAVVVTSATSSHAEVLHRVLPTGRPVLCEKPIALTLAQTERLIDLADEHGSIVQVGFQRRFDPGLRELHRRCAAAELGTLYAMRLMSHDHEPSDAAFIGSSGGIFRDLHVHDLDLVAWLTGSPVSSVHATVAVREHGQYDVHHATAAGSVPDGDVALIHAVTASGVQVSIHGARHDPRGHDVRVEAYGSADSVCAGLTERTPLLALDGARAAAGSAAPAGTTLPYAGFVDRFREAFRAETSAFVDLACGGPNPCPPQAALDALRAAVACEVSVLSGRPVRVDEIVTTEQ